MFDEAVEAGAADDKVVEEGDAQDLGGFAETTGDLDVFRGRVEATGGVVVSNDDSAGVLDDSGVKDFAGMNNCAIHQAYAYDVNLYELMGAR